MYLSALKKCLPLIVVVNLTCCIGASAQSFKLMRFDESYTYLKDSVRSQYERIKFIPFNQAGSTYVSFGGEARFEYANFHNEDWGSQQLGLNDFLLQRYDIHADLHAGTRIRFFAQLRSAREGGRKNGARPIDEDKLNIQNLFADITPVFTSKDQLTFRLGRQELDFGSGRLISVREGPNARLYFTGARVMLGSGNFKADGFVMMADTVNSGAFDNKLSKQANLWGLYNTLALAKSGNIDLYYIGIHRDHSVFADGEGKESRHTIGSRYWRYGAGLLYNIETALQFGTFTSSRIRAWTASADLGYMFENAKWRPTINIRNDYISGDGQLSDGRLNTFNPIYPKGGYFGFDPQIGPANLIDVHPYANLVFSNKLTVQGDVVFNWRYALNDGLYRPSGNFSVPGASSGKRYIGTAYLISAVYSFSKFFTMNTGLQYFHTGEFINDIINDPKDGLFINTRINFKF